MKLGSATDRKVEKLQLSNLVLQRQHLFHSNFLADSLHIYMALKSSYFAYSTSQTKKNITLTVLMTVEARD